MAKNMLIDHAWDIWALSSYESKTADSGLGVSAGLTIFLNNVRAGEAVSANTDPECKLDWAALKAEWDAMDDKTQLKTIADYQEATGTLTGCYTEICAAWREQDKAKFEQILADHTAPEQTTAE